LDVFIKNLTIIHITRNNLLNSSPNTGSKEGEERRGEERRGDAFHLASFFSKNHNQGLVILKTI